MSRQHGNWINVTANGSASVSHWPPSVAVSTCAIVVSAEQAGHFHSVRGTDKIVLSESTTLPQTAPVRSEHDQESAQSNTPHERRPSKS
jgi:hypothetical protein